MLKRNKFSGNAGKYFSVLAVLCFAAIMFAACDTGGTVSSGDTVTVYIPGTTNGHEACYWVNNDQITLNHPGSATKSVGKYITVFQGDIYVAGYYREDSGGSTKDYACYWVNDGAPVTLPVTGTLKNSSTTGIAVSDDGIYIAGYYSNESDSKLCYWVDKGTGPVEIPLTVSEGSIYSSETSGIAVAADGKVYIAGYYKIDKGDSMETKVCYWVDDGTPTNNIDMKILNGAEDPKINAITASGGSVYMAGDCSLTSVESAACYWKNNNECTVLHPQGEAIPSDATAIAVSGSTVYTAGVLSGEEGASVACYWKDTKFYDIAPAGVFSMVMGITVHNGSPYLAGAFYNTDGIMKSYYWNKGKNYTTGVLNGNLESYSCFIEVK